MVKKCTICKCEMEERRMIGLFTGRIQYWCPDCSKILRRCGEGYANYKTCKTRGKELKEKGKVRK